jgi:hypothetical protein
MTAQPRIRASDIVEACVAPIALAFILAGVWVALLAIPTGILIIAMIVVGAPIPALIAGIVGFVTALILF